MTDIKSDTPPDAAAPVILGGTWNWVALGVACAIAASVLLSMLIYSLRQQVVLASMQPETRPLAEAVDTRMTDPVILAGAIVTVIAALSAAVVSIINAKSAADDRKEAKVARVQAAEVATATAQKTDVLIGKTEQIHTLTNSNLSQVTAALSEARAESRAEIDGLKALVKALTDAKRVEDTLRTQQVSASAPVIIAPPPVPTAPLVLPEVATTTPVSVPDIVTQLDHIQKIGEDSNTILKENLVQAVTTVSETAAATAVDVANTAAATAAEVATTAAKVASKAAGIAAGQLDSIEHTGEDTNKLIKGKEKPE